MNVGIKVYDSVSKSNGEILSSIRTMAMVFLYQHGIVVTRNVAELKEIQS